MAIAMDKSNLSHSLGSSRHKKNNKLMKIRKIPRESLSKKANS